MFHILSALALKKNFTTSKHQQLIGWFNKEYVKTGIVEIKYGKLVKTAFEMRSRGDYDDFVQYSKVETSQQCDAMKEFIVCLKRLLQE